MSENLVEQFNTAFQTLEAWHANVTPVEGVVALPGRETCTARYTITHNPPTITEVTLYKPAWRDNIVAGVTVVALRGENVTATSGYLGSWEQPVDPNTVDYNTALRRTPVRTAKVATVALTNLTDNLSKLTF
ncbi:MAG TPA: hypothetical protein VLH86_02745 [Patescibacteria group bacterium]|nr:hypothetical protein [Patescibacteria group bacterium]